MKLHKPALPFVLFFVLTGTVQASAHLENGLIKENAYETEHYRLEFSDLMMDQVDDDNNGLPDIVDTVAEAAEYSYGVLMEDLGYEDPMHGDGKLLIILDDNDQYLNPGTLGVTSLLSNGDPYVAIDPWMDEAYLKVTTGHELFHTVQFGYGADFAYVYPGINWAEATATWVEDVQYDAINDYVNYLSDFFSYPDYSIFASIVPSGSLFEYGLNIWPRFLSEYYGEDVIRQIWEDYVASDMDFESDLKLYEVVKDVVGDQGDDLNEVFRQFTLWNLDLSNYEEGGIYPDVSVIYADTDPDYQTIEDYYAPALYGTNYLYFENEDNEESFYFHVQKPEGIRFALTLVPYGPTGVNIARSVSVIVDPEESMDDTLELSNLSAQYGVYAVVSPLDRDFTGTDETENFDQGYLYNFWAQFASAGQDYTVDSGGTEGDSSDVKEGETSTGDKGVLPDTLNLRVVSYNEDSVTLSWNRLISDAISSYEIHYGTDLDALNHTKSIEHSYTVSATVDGLEEGQTYYFELEGVNENGVGIIDASAPITVTPAAWIFSDVSYLNEYYAEINALVDEGVFRGYADGSFQPQATINRAELLKILIEGQGITPLATYNSCFTDVGTDWYAKYVCYAKEQGWIEGYSDGSFRPGTPVNKVEALKMLFKIYEAGLEEGQSVSELPYADLATDDWYSVYVEAASSLGILAEEPGIDFQASEGRTRGAMAVELYRYLVLMDLIRQ